MKRLALTVPLASLAVSALLPVLPASAEAAYSFRGSTNGIDTYAFTNDLPAGDPVPGVTYHAWSLDASYTIPDGGGHQAFAVINYIEEVYTFDANGDYVGISNGSGYVSAYDGGAVTYTAAKDLTTAHVVATVPLESCDETGTCTPTGVTRAVDVTWTGTGPVTHGTISARFGGDALLADYHSVGDQRDATVTGLPGTPNAAGFFSGRTAFHFVIKL